VVKAGQEELATMVRECGPFPDEEAQARILALAETLPATAPLPLGLPGTWMVDDGLRDRAGTALTSLDDATRSDAAGASTLLGVLQKALTRKSTVTRRAAASRVAKRRGMGLA
jgi:hypothetical protein